MGWILKKGADVKEAELIRHVKERLARSKVPTVVHIVDAIPLGPTGKVQRIKLADALRHQSSNGRGVGEDHAPGSSTSTGVSN